MKCHANSPPFSRDVAKRTKRSRRAYVMCSPKNGFVEIRLESRLEQSVAQALELDPRVRAYSTQPFTLDLTSGAYLAKKPSRRLVNAAFYTPDFVVELDDLQVVVEVKPRVFVLEHQELFAQVRSVLLKKGVRFVVVCEDSFPGHYLRNAQLFMQYLTQASDALPRWAAQLQTCASGDLFGSVSDVLVGLEPKNYYLAAGALLGVIKFDLSRHLFERMDFCLEPAFGALTMFEVLRYEP